MPEAEPHQVSTIVWLLQSGGFVPLVVGLVVALIGIVPLIRPSAAAAAFVGLLALLPAIFGLISVYYAASEYAEMAASPIPPKPAEFAAITGRAMSSSFCALLGTLLAVVVALMAMWRSGKRSSQSDSTSHSQSMPH